MFGYSDGDSTDPYLNANIANADTRDNIIASHVQAHTSMHSVDNASTTKASATTTVDPNKVADKNSQVTTTNKAVMKEEDVWNKPNPKKTHHHLTPSEKAEAKRRAKAAGRPYPNMVDNMAAAREEKDLGEMSSEKLKRYVDKKVSILPKTVNYSPRVPDEQKGKKFVNLALDKIFPKSAIRKPKVVATTSEELINEIGDSEAGKNVLRKTWYRANQRAISATQRSGEGLIGHLSGQDRKVMQQNHKVMRQVHKRIGDTGILEDATTETDPLAHLEDKLNKATDTSHNGVDKIMRAVANDFNMDVHDLHDKWVKKYKITPDQYVKEDYQTPIAVENIPSPNHYSAIKDIGLNTKNRNQTIKEYSYGPLNPNDENNNKEFWNNKADLWNTTVEAAKQARCENCAAFNQSTKVLKMIEDAIGQNGHEVQKEANLGFCELFEFKCAGARTCDAWLANGPLKEEVNDMFEEFTGCFLDIESDVSGIVEDNFISSGNELYEDWGEVHEEAEHQGKKVRLGKPFLTPGGPKKRAVYVKNASGNVVKVNFGDPHLSIKRDQPSRKASYRARHHCDSPGPRWKANYWSCKYWSSTPTSTLDKG